MRQHAVVLGAGIAGLFTAAVLAETYERVTIVERDPLPTAGQGRRGVPQGRHAHALMPRGTRLLDDLFPGIVAELIAAGAVPAEPLVDFRLRVGGRVLRQVPIGVPAVQASRPFLEGYVRNRARALCGVEVIDCCDVVGLVTAENNERVCGARVIRRAAGSAEEILPADLVVDAMGRGGRTPAWLAALGYPRPPQEEFRVGVAYASRYLRLPPGAGSLEKTIGVGPVPGRPRGMMMLAVEGDRRLLTLAGFTEDHRPPTDPEGFLAFAETIAPPDALAAIRAAEPLSDIAAYRYPSYLRRHYQRLRRFPDGLLVTGDALCSFSPIYAQGMTVAAMQATALRRCLRRGPDGLARRYFRTAARIVAGPWRMAVGADLALPEIEGRRTPAIRLLNAYSERVIAAAEHDATTARQFMRVTGLLDAPASLLRPGVLRRALRPAGSAPRP
jgi:2-polyprenyl-6-methoxyphenol hydroxylase-like FAD-dependent oxidoreductase